MTLTLLSRPCSSKDHTCSRPLPFVLRIVYVVSLGAAKTHGCDDLYLKSSTVCVSSYARLYVC